MDESWPGIRARTVAARSARRANPHRGPAVASFLRDEGIYEEARARAIKEVLALQIEATMKREGVTKTDLARRMATSRAAVDRLLDPTNASVTLGTLFRASVALGVELRVELRTPRSRASRKAGRGSRRR